MAAAFVPIRGIPVFVGTMEEAVDYATQPIGSNKPVRLMTVAAWTLLHATEEPSFLQILQRCWIVLPDGWPTVLLLRMRGVAIRRRLPGTEFVPAAAEWCARTGHKYVLYGSAAGVAQQAAAILRERYPGLDVAGITPPFQEQFSEKDADVIAGELKQQGPHIVAVGIADPKGEFLLDKLATKMPGVLFLGIGGGIDNVAGWRKRAPKLIRLAYLEWAFRTLQNPREKIPRMVENFKRFPRVFVSLLREPSPTDAGPATKGEG